MAAETQGLELLVRVPLPPGVAQVAFGALSPDLPLPPPPQAAVGEGKRRTTPRPSPHPIPHLQCCGEELVLHWSEAGPRGLRGGVRSLLELLGLVLETIERFGGGAAEGEGVGEGGGDRPLPPQGEDPSPPQ